MTIYQLYPLNASGQILDHSIEVECDHDEMARAVGSAQAGEHDAVEVWVGPRLVGRVDRGRHRD